MERKLDRLLAAHCAPALAGVKAANLVACSRAEYAALPRLLERYRTAFAPRGVRFEIVGACPARYLLLVYHHERLAQHLRQDGARRLLRAFGYPPAGGLEALLRHLERRAARADGFPHEIGLFLGYPPEDVAGFIAHGGRGCKLCGTWKVYGDAEAAARQFERLTRVRRAVCRRVARGESLLQVFAAA